MSLCATGGALPSPTTWRKLKVIDETSSHDMSVDYRVMQVREIVVSFISSLETNSLKAEAISLVISYGGLGGSVVEPPVEELPQENVLGTVEVGPRIDPLLHACMRVCQGA